MAVEVVWLFSMIRSGSSVAAYGAAAPWGHAVADEVFGPWVRTDAVYGYPEEQRRLRDLFRVSNRVITPEIAAVAERLFEKLGAGTGRVVCKMPHDAPSPGEVARAWPQHRVVFLLRNPLHRLNSVYIRSMMKPGGKGPIGPGFDLEPYKAFSRAWLDAPGRILYDDLNRDPVGFFRAIYAAWGWEAGTPEIEAAVRYARGHYHHWSKKSLPAETVDGVESERRFALPADAIRTYLEDPFVRDLMRRNGWSTDARDYQGSPTRRTAPTIGLLGRIIRTVLPR